MYEITTKMKRISIFTDPKSFLTPFIIPPHFPVSLLKEPLLCCLSLTMTLSIFLIIKKIFFQKL